MNSGPPYEAWAGALPQSWHPSPSLGGILDWHSTIHLEILAETEASALVSSGLSSSRIWLPKYNLHFMYELAELHLKSRLSAQSLGCRVSTCRGPLAPSGTSAGLSWSRWGQRGFKTAGKDRTWPVRKILKSYNIPENCAKNTHPVP